MLQSNTYIYRAFQDRDGLFKEYYFKVKGDNSQQQREVDIWNLLVRRFPASAATYFVEVGESSC